MCYRQTISKISIKCLKKFTIIFFINLACVQSYGEDCRYPCSLQCYNNTCDRLNGRCLLGCKNRFYGELCERGNNSSDIVLNIIILSQSLKRSTFPYERLAIAEQKQSKLSDVPKRWTELGDWWAHTETKRSAKGSTRWTVNARSTQDKRFVRYEFVFDFLVMMCSSGKHWIMCRGGGGGGVQSISQMHESEVNYSSMRVFEEGWGSGLTQPFLSLIYERGEQNCER